MAEMDKKTELNAGINFPDRLNAFVAGIVFLIALTVYYITKAATLSFWDCGEFIASSYILGIPHPPGTPLYILLGRIFSLLPLSGDIAVRVNMLSVIPSAISVMFGYLVTVQILRHWYSDNNNLFNRLSIIIGGFTGALFMAFANTNWSNSVEAEVYSLTIMLMTIMYWLALKYFDNKESFKGSRLLLLMVYLAILGVGIHLTLFLIVPILAMYFILKKESTAREWTVIALFFVIELFLIFLLSSRSGEIPYFLPVLIIFVVFIFHTIMRPKAGRATRFAFWAFLLALYPLYFVVVESLSRNILGAGLAPVLQTIGKLPIGWIGLGSLTIWGGYAFFNYFQSASEKEKAVEWLTIGIYSLAPAVLLGFDQVLSGYYAFLFLSLILGLAALLIIRHQINWLMLIGFGSIALIIIGFWKFVLGMLAGLVVIFIVGKVFGDRGWKTAAAIIVLAVIGFSVHLYLPIRSTHNPRIDENDPSSSYQAFIDLLERKQYGNISMTERMFTRKGDWSNQFGDYQRMGFWRFFKDQYGFAGGRFFIPLLLGLFGIWETIRRKAAIGLPFFTVILLSSVGLILYMNFADGTRIDKLTGMDYLEVRDRDYFFTPAFVFFGLAIGLGIASFIDLVRETFSKFSANIRKISVYASMCLVLLPLVPLTNNYFTNNRSRNYIPYDYAANVLNSCDKDAILITAGDNDTFPLWCVQEVYNHRRDVRVINLSLANMGWYIKQLRDNFQLPISWTDEQIDRLRPYRDQEGTPFRIQNQVVDHIITTNKWQYPIYFIVSSGEDNLRYHGKPILDYLILEGLVFRLLPNKDEPDMDIEKTVYLSEEVYSYRGISENNIYKDETARRLTSNYGQTYLFLADSLKKARLYDSAFYYIEKAKGLINDSYDAYIFQAQVLGEIGRLDTLEAFIANCPAPDKSTLYFNWAVSAKLSGRIEDAIAVFKKTLELYPHHVDAFRAFVGLYYQNQMYSPLRELTNKWVSDNPADTDAQMLLKQINRIDPSLDSLGERN